MICVERESALAGWSAEAQQSQHYAMITGPPLNTALSTYVLLPLPSSPSLAPSPHFPPGWRMELRGGGSSRESVQSLGGVSAPRACAPGRSRRVGDPLGVLWAQAHLQGLLSWQRVCPEGGVHSLGKRGRGLVERPRGRFWGKRGRAQWWPLGFGSRR